MRAWGIVAIVLAVWFLAGIVTVLLFNRMVWEDER